MKVMIVKKTGRQVSFRHRDDMKRCGLTRAEASSVPATTLPVDGTNNMGVKVPMDGNDTLGICGPAMCRHDVDILTYRQGKGTQIPTNLAALEKQYLQVSGGDNGTDEDMLVGPKGIYTVAGGGLEYNVKEVVADSLDFDVTNVPLTQYLIDQFYNVKMAWSVPDAFLDEFDTAVVFDGTPTPDPYNGHYTPLADVDASGKVRCITWGSWCWMTPSYVKAVQPECFVSISPLQFDPKTGLDSKGRHVTEQAAKWIALGGSKSKMNALMVMFPPLTPPAPVPVPPAPVPVPPAPVPTPTPGTMTIHIPQQPVMIGGYPAATLPAFDVTATLPPTAPAPSPLVVKLSSGIVVPLGDIIALVEDYLTRNTAAEAVDMAKLLVDFGVPSAVAGPLVTVLMAVLSVLMPTPAA